MKLTPVESLTPRRPSGEPVNMDFQSIESTCPLWRTARVIIETFLPQQLEFRIKPGEPYTMELDDDWVRTIQSVVPPEDAQDIYRRLMACQDIINMAMPRRLLESFLQQPSSTTTARALNFAMRCHDDYLAAHGFATLPQCIEHAMGIRQARSMLLTASQSTLSHRYGR